MTKNQPVFEEFGLFEGQKEQFDNITLDSAIIFHNFQTFYRLNNDLKEILNR